MNMQITSKKITPSVVFCFNFGEFVAKVITFRPILTRHISIKITITNPTIKSKNDKAKLAKIDFVAIPISSFNLNHFICSGGEASVILRQC